MKGKKLHKWISSEVDYSSLTQKDLEIFGGIEELTDYKLIKHDKEKGFRVIKSGKVKKKKKSKVKAKKVAEDSIDVPMASEEADMSAWCNCYVPDEILSALRDMGFYKPTQVQELALPPAIRDHLDILAAAETGSGKTLAFGIPMISHILAAKRRAADSQSGEKQEITLKGLVLLPTRELAIQVKNHLLAITKYVDVKIITIVGGMSEEKQRRLLQKSPDIIVATPGRLWQLMEEGEKYLEQIPFVRYLVIDEADRMFEQGHFEELTSILEMINSNKVSKRRQNFVFSATLTMVHELPKRLDIKKKGKVIKKNKLESLMAVIGISEKPKIIDITQGTGVVETLTESHIMCSLEEKDVYLYYFVTMYPGRTLVFCNSKDSLRRLKSVFEHLGRNPLTLHAAMHQSQRLKNLDRFASSKDSLLLATDVAARGLDIRGIEHVVHFQVPATVETYIHRSGRTARAQNEGLSLMLIEPKEAVYYKRICRSLNKDQPLPAFPVDFDALKVLKEPVMLAVHIEKQEHRVQRQSSNNRWFQKMANDAEIELDENLLVDLGDSHEQAVLSRKLKILKLQLKAMLKRPVLPKRFLGSYPTKSGKLLLPNVSGAEKAIHVVKDPSKVASTLHLKRKNRRKM